MAEHRLKPLTALGHDHPERVTIGPVTITEVADVALASVTARMGRLPDVQGAAAAVGIPLPAPGHWQGGSPYGAFWLATESWMVEAPFASHEDIRALLLQVFGDAASITEQTDAWARFDVAGHHLPDLFERLCAVDLRAGQPGLATRTVIDHLGCYLILRDESLVSVIGPRSSAAVLFHALETAAHSVF